MQLNNPYKSINNKNFMVSHDEYFNITTNTEIIDLKLLKNQQIRNFENEIN